MVKPTAANIKATAIVTGAAGDIGLAITERLLKDGMRVVLADRDLAGAERARTVLGGGDDLVPFACDITKPESLAELPAVARALGPIAVLVNNAGAVTAESLHTTTIENWRNDVALNLDGAFNCFKAVEADLKQNAGVVVNIASVNGLGTFGHPAYSAAKAGLIQFTKMLAVEYGKFGIRANAVAPGTVRTQAWAARAAANPEVFEEAARWYPLRRVPDPKDIANAVAFLTSIESSAISGICLPVDCGLMAGQPELAQTFSQSNDY